jgi:hypothetical protein
LLICGTAAQEMQLVFKYRTAPPPIALVEGRRNVSPQLKIKGRKREEMK